MGFVLVTTGEAEAAEGDGGLVVCQQQAQVLPPNPPSRGEAVAEELPSEALALQGKCSLMVQLGFREVGAGRAWTLLLESREGFSCGAGGEARQHHSPSGSEALRGGAGPCAGSRGARLLP